MRAQETLYDNNGKQVALFPLQELYISQGDTGTYSHDYSRYYATDCVGYINGNRVYRCPCYAPVDIELIWKDSTECCAMWKSTTKVHLADGTISNIGIIIYHDNDIENNTYYPIGTVKRMGEEFCRTGTGGPNVSGDHIHIEIGKGTPNLSQYKYHFLDNTDCKRIRIFNALYINDTTIIQNWTGYTWKTFYGGHPSPITPKKYRFKWVLYANKIRNKNY